MVVSNRPQAYFHSPFLHNFITNKLRVAFGTERPAMISVVEYFKDIEIDTEYCEDEVLLHAR